MAQVWQSASSSDGACCVTGNAFAYSWVEVAAFRGGGRVHVEIK